MNTSFDLFRRDGILQALVGLYTMSIQNVWKERQRRTLEKEKSEKDRAEKEKDRAEEERDRLRGTSAQLGIWRTSCQYSKKETRARQIPRNVSEKAVHFVQRWLTEWGHELQQQQTVRQLYYCFCDHFIPWFEETYRKVDMESIRLAWCDDYMYRKGTQTSADKYEILQTWTDKVSRHNAQPWVHFPHWICAKNITFENCLFAMNSVSGTFRRGIISINGFFKDPQSTIKWEIDFPYTTILFDSKKNTDRYKDDDKDASSDR